MKTPDDGLEGTDRVTRRRMLAMGGLTGAAVLGAPGAANAAHSRARPTADRPPPTEELVSYQETRLAFRNHGFHLETLDRPITPLGSHFLLIHFDVPELREENYSITIGGHVREPLTLRLEELKARTTMQQATILECAGVGRAYLHPRPVYVPWFNEPMGVYEYTGTPLRSILEQAGVRENATEVVFTGWDEGVDLGVTHPFERALPIDEAMKDGVMLAWAANGQPLLPAHGYPLRLIVPTWYGMASVKWLKSITVIDHTFQGVQQRLVYRFQTSSSDTGRPVRRKAVRAAMKPPGIPDLISRHRFLVRGRHVLQGMAWSGNGSITKVEVSTNDRRTWRTATLEPPVSPYAWTPWRIAWDAARAGEYILSCRATDSAGNCQPNNPVWNVQGMAQNGAERVPVRVR